jgi:hypothetical protein
MPDSWYIAINGAKVGPLTLQELKATLTTFANAKDIPVWRDGLADWKPVQDLPELRSQTAPSPPPLPAPRVQREAKPSRSSALNDIRPNGRFANLDEKAKHSTASPITTANVIGAFAILAIFVFAFAMGKRGDPTADATNRQNDAPTIESLPLFSMHSGWVTLNNNDVTPGGFKVFRRYALLSEQPGFTNLMMFMCSNDLAKAASHVIVVLPKDVQPKSFARQTWLPRMFVRFLIDDQHSVSMPAEYRDGEFYIDWNTDTDHDFRAIMSSAKLTMGFGDSNDIIRFQFSEKIDAFFSEAVSQFSSAVLRGDLAADSRGDLDVGQITQYSRFGVLDACLEYQNRSRTGRAGRGQSAAGIAKAVESAASLPASVAPNASATNRDGDSNSIVVNMSLTVTATNPPTIIGRTNLPDETILDVKLFGDPPACVPRCTIWLPDKPIVKNGRFSAVAGARSPTEVSPMLPSTLFPGSYTADVVVLPGAQPRNVQSVIGAKGEHLRGPHAVRLGADFSYVPASRNVGSSSEKDMSDLLGIGIHFTQKIIIAGQLSLETAATRAQEIADLRQRTLLQCEAFTGKAKSDACAQAAELQKALAYH